MPVVCATAAALGEPRPVNGASVEFGQKLRTSIGTRCDGINQLISTSHSRMLKYMQVS
jgi:hypothetical protein